MPTPTPMPRYRSSIPIFDDLRGERVVLRGWGVADAEALREAIADSRDHLRPWMPFADEHQSVEETRDWIVHSMARQLLRESFDQGIWELEGGRLLGGIGADPQDWAIPSFEIGYWLRASAEGHGYMTEAVRLLTDCLFIRLEAQRVQIRCDARNRRSAAVPRRLGFVAEGCLRNYARATDGSLEDTLVFALIASDPRWPGSGPG
jgi:RimJ/RimL family protein N-acetyltransferase